MSAENRGDGNVPEPPLSRNNQMGPKTACDGSTMPGSAKKCLLQGGIMGDLIPLQSECCDKCYSLLFLLPRLDDSDGISLNFEITWGMRVDLGKTSLN